MTNLRKGNRAPLGRAPVTLYETEMLRTRAERKGGQKMNIVIDEEFRTLIPPLTEEERTGLEASILSEGCRDALVLWGDILIDGHNRYDICTKNNIPFKTIEKTFDNRDSVIEWIISNQFGRRNLPAHERARLALRLKPILAEKAKHRQGSRNDINIDQKSDQCRTFNQLAEVAGVSHDTMHKVEKVEKEAPKVVVQASRKGDISVNAAYEVTKMEPEQKAEVIERIENGEKPKEVIQDVKKKPFVVNNSGNNEWYTPPRFIEAARKVMGSIDLDPASCELANENVNATRFYSIEDDGLTKTWTGNVWMNPPYSAGLIEKFIEKLAKERENYNQAIVLVNNSTETGWFHRLSSVSSAVCFPTGRTKFLLPSGSEKGAPLQGQAIMYIGRSPELFLHEFRELGWVARIV